MTTTNSIISFSQVNKWYGQFHVLKDLNLEVAPGENVRGFLPERRGGRGTRMELVAVRGEHEAITRMQVQGEGDQAHGRRNTTNRNIASIRRVGICNMGRAESRRKPGGPSAAANGPGENR